MNTSNQNISFKGNKLKVSGRELHVGDKLPAFQLTGNDLKDFSEGEFKGKTLIISVVPSLDTPVCSIQTKRFNEEASKLSSEIKILTVSMDLPFAQSRFCKTEGTDQVVTASDFKNRVFGENFGVFIPDMGLLARAVFVADKSGTVRHVEYVPDISSEPTYDAALNVAKNSV